MILYHTSTISVEKPDILHSRPYLDFGKGFYLTSIYEQAERYAQRFIRRNLEAWLCSYDFNFDPAQWNTLSFDSYNRDWLKFVSECRAGHDNSDFDIVIGGIANDKVIQTLDRFFNGEISEDAALGLLKFERPNIQYCIRSQELLNQCLTHITSKKL